MILSNRLLRMANVTGVCEVCGSTEVRAFDPDTDAKLCEAHVILEDMDPDWPGNAIYVTGSLVSRRAVIPDAQSFNDLVTRRNTGRDRGPVGVWVSAAISEGLRLRSVDVIPALEQKIQSEFLYGAESKAAQSLDKFYYLHVTRRGDNAFVHLKFQVISGGHLLAVVPWKTVFDFFGSTR